MHKLHNLCHYHRYYFVLEVTLLIASIESSAVSKSNLLDITAIYDNFFLLVFTLIVKAEN